MPCCGLCKKSFPAIKSLVFHLQLSHSSNLQKFVCGEQGCFSKFDLLKSFKRHLKKNHSFSNELVPNVVVPKMADQDFENGAGETGDIIDQVENSTSDTEADQPSVHDLKKAFIAQRDAFVAKLYSKRSLPRNCIQDIICDTDVLLGSDFNTVLREKCLRSLRACNANACDINDIHEMFDVLQDPFKDVKSEFLRLKRFELSGCYIPPVPYRLGVELLNKRKKNGMQAEWIPVEGQHFPLRYTLQKFLALPDCLNDILTYIDSLKYETESISNFVQGELWKTKLLNFPANTIVLPLFIFFDDFECNNPLGPNSGKLGGVYATLPCLPPECRSALENIFLCLLFNSKDREEFQNKKTLDPLIKELIFLEQTGISVTTKNSDQRVFFCLGLVIGDNLGVHQICNLVEGFKANYPCRFCKANKEVMQTMFKVDLNLIRSQQNYEADVLLNDVSKTGVNARCEFNIIPSFHITSNYAVDVMHDLAEGCVRYVMGFVVADLIAKKYFTLYLLNNRLRMFDYGKCVSNKPPLLLDDHIKNRKIKMSSSQAFCFARHFGVLVGDLVSNSDMSWRLYLCLTRVIDVALAKRVSKGTSETFPILVEELLQIYTKLGNNIKPKFHYLLHYGYIFKMCGPVSHLSCMRFEGKHRDLTQSAVTNMSRVNLSYSVGVKHQLKFCSRLMANERICPGLESGSAQKIVLSMHEQYNSFVSSLPDSFKSDVAVSFKWVDYKGTHYSLGMVLVIDRDDSMWWPTFGKIMFILVQDEVPLFVCSKMDTIGFSEHFNGFEVTLIDSWICVKATCLLDPLPLHDCKAADGAKFVILRYSL